MYGWNSSKYREKYLLFYLYVRQINWKEKIFVNEFRAPPQEEFLSRKRLLRKAGGLRG